MELRTGSIAVCGEGFIERRWRFDPGPASRDIATDRLDISIVPTIRRRRVFALLPMCVEKYAVLRRHLAISVGEHLCRILMQQYRAVLHSIGGLGLCLIRFG